MVPEERLSHMQGSVALAGEQTTTKEEKMKVRFAAILSVGAAMKAVESDGDALRYVKDQTEAVCLKAVESNGYALQYVKDQTEAVCLKAVESNGYALQYVLNKKLFASIASKLGIDIEF